MRNSHKSPSEGEMKCFQQAWDILIKFKLPFSKSIKKVKLVVTEEELLVDMVQGNN